MATKLIATLELDSKPFIDTLKSTAASTTQFSDGIKNEIGKKLSEVTVGFDTSKSDAQIEETKRKLAEIPLQKFVIDTDISKVDAGVEAAKKSVSQIADTKITPKITPPEVPAGAQAAGQKLKDKVLEGFKGFESGAKGIINTALGFVGGAALTKGISGVVGSFGELIEKGKGSLEATQKLEIAFATAGLKGGDLSKAVSETSKNAAALSNQFAMPISYIRQFSQTAASIGGATGKANTDLTKLAIGIEKATNGMVSGDMAIRIFSKGVSDPESSFALGRLTKQFPALATALKDVKDPAESTQKALAFFGGTFDMIEKQAGGPIGSMNRLQNSLAVMKSSLGRVIIDAAAPFIEAFSTKFVPVIHSAVSIVKSFSSVLQPLQPIFLAAGVGLAALVGGMLALKGLQFLTGLATQAAQFGLALIQKVIPALITETTLLAADGTATTSLTIAKNALSISTLKDAAAKGIHALATSAAAVPTMILTAAQWALNAAFLASPIGWIVLGIGAVVVAFVLLYKNVKVVRDFMNTAWDVVVAVFNGIWEVIKKVGEIIYEVGKIIVMYLFSPFIIAWEVASKLRDKMVEFMGSLFGVSDAAESTGGVVNAIGEAFTWLVSQLEYALIFAKSVLSAFKSIISNIADGIVSILTLDFSGAADAFGSIGSDAADAFNAEFQRGLDEKNWNEAAKNLETVLADGLKIGVSIDSKDSLNKLVDDYAETEQRIAGLRQKQSTGDLTAEERNSLTELETKAQATALQIGKLAPEARSNFRNIVDSAGQIKEVYDINIEKAKEYASAITETGKKSLLADQYTANLQTQIGLIDKAKEAQYLLKVQIDTTNDPAKKKELMKQYDDENERIKTLGKSLDESFRKGAAAGLLTEDAIKAMAKELNITDEQAKKLALGAALEDAQKKGAVTETAIKRIAGQFNVTTDEVKNMIAEQKKSTAEAEATALAALSIGDAYDESAKKAKEAAEKSVSQVNGLRKRISEYDAAMKKGSTVTMGGESLAEKKKELEEQLNLALESGKKEAAYYKEYEKGQKESKDAIWGAEKKQKETATKETISFEQSRAKLIDGRAKREADAAKAITEQTIKSYENEIKAIKALENVSENEKLRRTLELELKILEIKRKSELDASAEKERVEKLSSEKSLIQELGKRKENQKTLLEYSKSFNEIESDKTKTAAAKQAEIQALNDATAEKMANATIAKNKQIGEEFKALYADIQSYTNENQLQTDLMINRKYDEESLTKTAEADKQIEANNIKLEKETLKARLSLINQNNKERIEQARALKQQLLEIEYADVSTKSPSDMNEIELARYKEFSAKKTEIDKAAKIANINLTQDEEKRKTELALLELQYKLDNELALAEDNYERMKQAEASYQADRAKIIDEYTRKNNLAYQISADAINSFREDLFKKEEERDNEETKRKRDELNKQNKDLQNSLKKNEVSSSEYIAQLISIQTQQAENEEKSRKKTNKVVVALEKAATKAYSKEVDKRQKSIDEYDGAVEKSTDKRLELFALESTIMLATGQFTWSALGEMALKAALDFGLKWLAQKMPVWITGIFASTVSEAGGILGPPIAAANIATLTSYAAAAGYADEGYNPGVKELGKKRGANDTRLTWFDPVGEAIIPKKILSKEKALVDFWFAGGSSLEYFTKNFGANASDFKLKPDAPTFEAPSYEQIHAAFNPQYNINVETSRDGSILKELSAMRTELSNATNTRRINVQTAVKHEFGELSFSNRKISTTILKSRKRDLLKGV